MATTSELLSATLAVVTATREGGWEKGDTLAIVPADATLQASLVSVLSRGLERFEKLTRADQARWGALMLFYGSVVFRNVGSRPRTYSTIAAEMGHPHLKSEMTTARLDAMEHGARVFLGLSIVQAGLNRGFVETMIAHAGVDGGLVERIGNLVSRRWDWPSLEAAGTAEISKFLSDQRSSLNLRAGMDALLGSPVERA